MSHEECINAPLVRIYKLIEKIEEQKVIELDFFRITMAQTISGFFNKKTKSMYELFFKDKYKELPENKKAQNDFNSMIDTLFLKKDK